MSDKVLDEFVNDYKLLKLDYVSVVSAPTVYELEQFGFSVEDLLNYIGLEYRSLFHGSRSNIIGSQIRRNDVGWVYASSLPSISIMRAVVSNVGLRSPGLTYPYFVNEETPLELRIFGLQFDTISETGFVYLIPSRFGFDNDPVGSWQYAKKDDVPFSAKIQVHKSDFNYPIYDGMANKRIN